MRHRLLWLTCAWLALPLGGSVARADSAADAETWVRQIYYEGFPAELALELDDPAVEALVEMLDDPAEAAYHGNIVLALGLRAHPLSYATLSALAETPPDGEVDRATFRAHTQVRIALGQLARKDGRALRWLLDADQGDELPTWHFRNHRGARLRVLLDELTWTGLALSGTPAAAAHLDRVIERSQGPDAATQRRRRHAESSRALLERARADRAAGRQR
jgi:hypothetical protein